MHQTIEARIAEVRFEGLTRVNPEYLRTLTSVHAGDTVDTAAISRDAARMAVVDDLDGVEYKLTGDPAFGPADGTSSCSSSFCRSALGSMCVAFSVAAVLARRSSC